MKIEFELSDREFSDAWWGEYLRRPTSIARFVLGPLLVLVALRMLGEDRSPSSIFGVASLALGLWWIVKPFMVARMMVRERRHSNAARRRMQIELGDAGLTISDGTKTQLVPWARVRNAGQRATYVYFELVSGLWGTIPLRSVERPEVLRGHFERQGKWRGASR